MTTPVDTPGTAGNQPSVHETEARYEQHQRASGRADRREGPLPQLRGEARAGEYRSFTVKRGDGEVLLHLERGADLRYLTDLLNG